ncbi:MAG: hypothetical protein Q4B58_08560, partial [Bacteroidales bacterium]|nr:hypothetical protein [Bacteroidales bacterium]
MEENQKPQVNAAEGGEQPKRRPRIGESSRPVFDPEARSSYRSSYSTDGGYQQRPSYGRSSD